jgi:hypothetical protein
LKYSFLNSGPAENAPMSSNETTLARDIGCKNLGNGFGKKMTS